MQALAKDTSDNYQDGLLELYKKIRPGEPLVCRERRESDQ